jgi:hypothetical protein
MLTKICSCCNKTKNLDGYYARKGAPDGHQGICKECMTPRFKESREKNREKRLASNKRYREENREKSKRGEIIIPERKICCTCKIEKPNSEYIKVATRVDGLSPDCNDCNRIKQQKYRYKDHEGYKKRTRENYQKNKEHINERNRENSKKPEAKEKKKIRMRNYMRERRKVDPVFRMVSNLRNRHRMALNGELKAAPTLEMLGCSSKIAFWFLEQQYYPHPETGEEMTQENYGLTTWNYDHIMPLITFDYSDPDQQRKAFHITNCRPMWADENKSRPDTRPEGVTFEDLRKPLFTGEELKND